MLRVVSTVFFLASLYLPPSNSNATDSTLTAISINNILENQTRSQNLTGLSSDGSTTPTIEKYLNQDHDNPTNKSREIYDSIVKSSKKLQELELKLDKHTIKCTKKGNLTHIKEVMGYTKGFIKKLNISLNEVKNQYNSSLEEDEEIMYSSLKKTYEEKLQSMSGRLLALEHLCTVITHYNSFNKTWKQYDIMRGTYLESKNNTILNETCTAAREMAMLVETQIEEMKTLNELLEIRNLEKYFSNPYTVRLRNTTYWMLRLEESKKASQSCEMKSSNVDYENSRIVLWQGVLPVFLGVIFVVGFLSNIFLLLIFSKVKEMRRGPNSMVLNLAVADVFNLIVNIPIFYAYFMSDMWQLGLNFCILYRFMAQLGRLVSVYSVVAISVQKFLALRSYLFINIKSALLRKLNNQITIIVSVWLISSLLAVPEANKAGVYGGQCLRATRDDTYFHKWYSIYVLFCLFIVPGILITTSSLLNAVRIQESIRQIPGEGIGHDRRKRARQVSSNILIALAVVSLVSYAPISIYSIVNSWVEKDYDKLISYIFFLIAFSLQFANACFNPIALYIVSRKYKVYFKRYILCRKKAILLERNTTLTKSTRTTSAS